MFHPLEFKAGNPEVFKMLRDCRFARESTTLSSKDRFAGWRLGWDVASRHVLGDGHLPGWSKGMPRKPCPGCLLSRSPCQEPMGSTEDKAPSLISQSLGCLLVQTQHLGLLQPLFA